ncbi:MAG TPA: xylose isomerase [Verrucomicrobiae bacterium]|nr:xylose isomerase [Verrucomicrobiae bacterium]
MKTPVLRHIANLWTFLGHPSPENEWSLEQKLRAIKEAGFDGVCWAGSPELGRAVKKLGLIFIGGMSSGKAAEFPRLLQEQKDAGAHHVNVQLADDDTLTPEALDLAQSLVQEGRKLGLEPAVEVHRDTCTETPGKTYALADAYQKVTGELLPISWDFSHISVVKHLHPGNYAERMIVRPDLIRRAQQFHFRPFNGHHAQVPVSDGKGHLTQEVKDWLPFAEAVLRCWLDGNRNTDREIFICPEMGPVVGGYALSTFPNSWEEAKILRGEIDKLWKKVNR